MNETTVSYPYLLKRLQSTIIDMLVTVGLMLFASQLLNALGDEKDTPEWINIVMFVAIWGLYEPVCTAFACTLGNYIMRIRVRRVEDVSNVFRSGRPLCVMC